MAKLKVPVGFQQSLLLVGSRTGLWLALQNHELASSDSAGQLGKSLS
jgi:hypothetical protein